MITVEVNAETGEITERQMTPDEKAQWQEDAQAAAEAATAEAERQTAAASARQKIAEASGLTAEEMAALGF